MDSKSEFARLVHSTKKRAQYNNYTLVLAGDALWLTGNPDPPEQATVKNAAQSSLQ